MSEKLDIPYVPIPPEAPATITTQPVLEHQPCAKNECEEKSKLDVKSCGIGCLQMCADIVMEHLVEAIMSSLFSCGDDD